VEQEKEYCLWWRESRFHREFRYRMPEPDRQMQDDRVQLADVLFSFFTLVRHNQLLVIIIICTWQQYYYSKENATMVPGTIVAFMAFAVSDEREEEKKKIQEAIDNARRVKIDETQRVLERRKRQEWLERAQAELEKAIRDNNTEMLIDFLDEEELMSRAASVLAKAGQPIIPFLIEKAKKGSEGALLPLELIGDPAIAPAMRKHNR